MTEKYESKQQRALKPAETIYGAISDFNNFTPFVTDKVEGWSVEGDSCSFTVKGFPMRLWMTEKVPGSLIKIESDDASPMGLRFWVQMKEAAPYDTRFRLVLHADMNMMLKMMIGSKIQTMLDSLAEQMARTFNAL